ncbi:MAG: EAL domain-containing protein [Phycisphaeraceae bacterium]
MHRHSPGGAQALVLLAPEFDRDYPEFTVLDPGPDWQPAPALGAVHVRVGPGSRWPCGADVVHFLRSVLDEPRVGRLRAAWVPAEAPMQTQLQTLIHAPPLLELIGSEESPLLSILRQHRLETWFQPIFHAGDLMLWGYECLMRGRTEDGRIIPPAELLESARREQLVDMLDCVARETHLHNAGRAMLSPDTRLLINFMPSATQSADHCLKSTVRIATDHGIDPYRIIFEVVESERVMDRAHLANVLGHYREHGFGVALDDVGNGHAGLIMLADLDPDLIKIDRYLVQRALASSRHRHICASLVEFGHAQDKLVLAEGVEKVEEKIVMDRLGVDLYQGYLFARPAPEPATAPRERTSYARTG